MNDYPAQCEEKSIGQLTTPTITERLMFQRNQLQTELAKTNAALKAMEDNPSVAEVFNLVTKAIGRNL